MIITPANKHVEFHLVMDAVCPYCKTNQNASLDDFETLDSYCLDAIWRCIVCRKSFNVQGILTFETKKIEGEE